MSVLRIVLGLLVAVVLSVSTVRAEDRAVVAAEGPSLQELDASAVEAYRAQDYARAQQSWLAALEHPATAGSSAERARILHDLGNAAMRSDAPLEAVARYRASLELRPRAETTRANLDLARTEAGLAPADRPGLLGSLTLAEWERVVVVLALCVLATLLLEAYVGRAFRPAAVVAGLLLLASLFPWAAAVRASDEERAMVVARSGAPLRSEPRTSAKMLVRLEPGTEHLVADRLPEWVSVVSADGIAGWVRAPELLGTTR